MIAVNQLESNVRMSLFVIRDAVNSFSVTVKPQNKRQTHTSSTTMPHQLSTVMHEERDSIFINWVINKTRLPSLPLSFSSLLFNITFLASCLRPAGVRVKQTLFGVSRTEWLVLAWKPVSFPRATKSLRNRWDARNYQFLWFYSGLKDSKGHNTDHNNRILRSHRFFFPCSYVRSKIKRRCTYICVFSLNCTLFFVVFFFTETCQHIWKISS